MTGSAMGARRIGHRNSAGTSSCSFLAGDGGTGTSGGRRLGLDADADAGGKDSDRKGRSDLQRRARSAPISGRARRRRRSFFSGKAADAFGGGAAERQ
jgi:hypothetical protein